MLNNKGEVLRVPMRNFLASWQPYVQEFYPYADEHHGHSNRSFEIAAVKGLVLFALDRLSASVGRPHVCIQCKPVKQVLSLQIFKMQALVLLPETMNIVASIGGTKPASGLAVSVSGFDKAELFTMPAPLGNDASTHPFNVPMWAVQTTTDEKQANMQWTEVHIKVDTSVGKKNKKSENETCTIKFVAMWNHKPLKNGDELLIMKKDEQPAEAGQTVKKRRV